VVPSALDQRIQRLQIELLDERLHHFVAAFDTNVDVLHTRPRRGRRPFPKRLVKLVRPAVSKQQALRLSVD